MTGEVYEVAPRKPAWGKPCTGCGLCCVSTPCEVAIDYVPGSAHGQPCPALVWVRGRARCGIVLDPAAHLLSRPGVTADQHAAMGLEMLEHITGEEGMGPGCHSGPQDNLGSDVNRGWSAADYVRAGGWEGFVERCSRSDEAEIAKVKREMQAELDRLAAPAGAFAEIMGWLEGMIEREGLS